MAQLMPLLPTVSYFSKIKIGFTFLVPAHLGSPGKRAVKRVCVCVCVCVYYSISNGLKLVLHFRDKFTKLGMIGPYVNSHHHLFIQE